MPTVIPSPARLAAAAANVGDRVRHGHLADLRRMPHTVIDSGPQRTVFRYRAAAGRPQSGHPVLLVPPLAAPSFCFDLRRGCSLVQHLVSRRRPTYLVDYGRISFSDRDLGIEHWVEEVVPRAVEAVSRDAGGSPVHLVGWCLGGIFSLLTVADRPDLPVAGVTAVASPADFTAVPLVAPFRPLAAITGGRVLTAAYRVLGGAPAPLVRRAFQLTSVDKYVTRPLVVLSRLDDRDFLEQIEAVDHFTANMLAYPGRTFGQLYHRFFRANDLANGTLDLAGRRIRLSGVRVPVLVIAGASDVIAPRAAVRRLADLLPRRAGARFEVAPGGHLGVLTGRAARHTTWRHIDGFLEEHDARRPVARPRQRRAARRASA